MHFALAGEVGFEPCYAEVLRVVQGKLHQPDEIQRSSFYAFSYYYDRAVDTHMIGKFTPGVRSGQGGHWARLWWERERDSLKCLVGGDHPTLLQCWLLSGASYSNGRGRMIENLLELENGLKILHEVFFLFY